MTSEASDRWVVYSPSKSATCDPRFVPWQEARQHYG